jgi:hypothetical protein
MRFHGGFLCFPPSREPRFEHEQTAVYMNQRHWPHSDALQRRRPIEPPDALFGTIPERVSLFLQGDIFVMSKKLILTAAAIGLLVSFGAAHAQRQDPAPSGQQRQDPAPSGQQRQDPAPSGQQRQDPAPSGQQRQDPAPSGQQRQDPAPSGQQRQDPAPSGQKK